MKIPRHLTMLCLAALCAAASARANVLGIHTMIQDNAETQQQLDEAAALCGWGGWVKQLLYIQDGTEWRFDAKWLEFVDGARRRQLNVVARLHYLPPSFRADPNDFASKPRNDADGSFTTFKDLVRGFVARFDGKLHYVEIWNEPNLQGEWNNQPDAQEWVKVMMAGYDGVKEADPYARVLFPGLAPTNGTPDGRNIDNLVFLKQCFQSTYRCPRDGRTFAEHFDILGNHSYALNRPASYAADKFSVRGYTWEWAVCQQYRTSTPILITECGYALGNHDDTRYPAVTEEFRADNMVKAFRDIWAADFRVMGAMPYFLHASERVSDRPFFWVRDDGSHTPQYDAVMALTPVLADAPGNLVNVFGNRPTNVLRDPLNLADVAAILRSAAGTVDQSTLEPARIVTADLAPPGDPDGRLTVDDAAAALRINAGLDGTGAPMRAGR